VLVSDIFISYSRRDRSLVEPLAGALEHRGWSVWWDHRIVAGDAFDRVIEEAIQQSRLVIVVWSQRSVTSDWVRAEASYALENDKLIPILIDDAKLPLRFINTHTLPFIDWDGSLDSTTFVKLVGEIELLLHEAQRVVSPPFAPNALPARIEAAPVVVTPLPNATIIRPVRSGRSRLLMFGGAAAGIAIVVGIGAAVMLHGSSPPDAGSRIAAISPSPTAFVKPEVGQPARAPGSQILSISFDKGTDRLSEKDQTSLAQEAAYLASKGMPVRIDSYEHRGDGNPITVEGLAKLRALKVQRLLVDKGVDPNKLSIDVHIDDAAGDASGRTGPRVVLSASGS
jgi:hypothetical protein